VYALQLMEGRVNICDPGQKFKRPLRDTIFFVKKSFIYARNWSKITNSACMLLILRTV